MSVIKLVQNDTAPDIDVTLIDQSTGEPFDVSHAEDVVRFHFKKVHDKDSLGQSRSRGYTDRCQYSSEHFSCKIQSHFL